MRRSRWFWLVALLAAGLLALAGCGGDDEDDGGAAAGEETTQPQQLDKVTLQLKWVTQAQFAGYYAALEQGFYEDEGLDVTIRPGGPDIVPEQVVLGGQAEFGINWLDNTLATRDQGGQIVNIAQVFTRSGMTEVAFKDSGIDSIDDLRGKKVGVWLGGNEHKLFAALTKNGIDPQKDTRIVAQPFDMNLLLNREVDAAAAMTYNELAQVLEQENPETGQLYKLSDLNVIKMSDVGTGALEDGVFVREDWISDEENQDIAKRFLKASFKGWVFCRDNFEPCLKTVLDNGPTLGEGHQRWQLNEVNDLIWPTNEEGIGVMNPDDFKITADIAKNYKIIKKPATDDAYTTDHAEAAVAELKDEGVDVVGADFKKRNVEVTPGGE
ncbi:MAG: ABC transporter substrate-binding protein [Actinomycetota bacterium]|nr:ABC transporter substrate-binding protein [Actinomycetota bacterium]